jgi:hypothetical protein
LAIVGIITRSPALSLAEWLDCIDQSGVLVPCEPREIFNPFKGTKEMHRPAPGEVALVLEGVRVGAIEPGVEFDEDGELDVYGADDRHAEVRAAALAIATSMTAELLWLDES